MSNRCKKTAYGGLRGLFLYRGLVEGSLQGIHLCVWLGKIGGKGDFFLCVLSVEVSELLLKASNRLVKAAPLSSEGFVNGFELRDFLSEDGHRVEEASQLVEPHGFRWVHAFGVCGGPFSQTRVQLQDAPRTCGGGHVGFSIPFVTAVGGGGVPGMLQPERWGP